MNLDVSREQESSGIGIPEDEKEKPWRRRKKVSYAEPEVTETSTPSNSYDVKPSSYTADQAELLHKLEESYQVIYHILTFAVPLLFTAYYFRI